MSKTQQQQKLFTLLVVCSFLFINVYTARSIIIREGHFDKLKSLCKKGVRAFDKRAQKVKNSQILSKLFTSTQEEYEKHKGELEDLGYSNIVEFYKWNNDNGKF